MSAVMANAPPLRSPEDAVRRSCAHTLPTSLSSGNEALELGDGLVIGIVVAEHAKIAAAAAHQIYRRRVVIRETAAVELYAFVVDPISLGDSSNLGFRASEAAMRGSKEER